MKLSKNQKGEIRESFLAYAAAIPVESEEDFKKVQEILAAVTQDQYDSIDIPTKMKKAADKLNEYVKLFIEMNPNYSDRESYFRDLKKEINRNIDTIIQNEQIDVYTFGQEINSPDSANNIPVVQVLTDISNLTKDRIEILNKFLRAPNPQRFNLFDDDVLEEYIASSAPTRSPTLFGYARTSEVLQPKTANVREENLKILKSLASSPNARQFLFDESIRLDTFLELYQLNILREVHFREWGHDAIANYVKILADFTDQGLLAEKKPSRYFLLSLNPEQLQKVKTLVDEGKLSVDKLGKISKFDDIEKIRYDRFHLFMQLSKSLQQEIAKHLAIKDLANLRQASKQTKKLVDELITSPGSISKLFSLLEREQFFQFIGVYRWDGNFLKNQKPAFELEPKQTLIFLMQKPTSSFSLILHAIGTNLHEKQYSRISDRVKEQQPKVDEENKKKEQAYKERKAKYDEEEKKYLLIYDEYKKLDKEYRDNNKKGEAPIRPQRKVTAPSLPTREKVHLSEKEAMQIACYALTTTDVKKLDIAVLELAIDYLPKDSPKNLKPSLEKMIELLREAKIESLQKIIELADDEILYINLQGFDAFKKHLPYSNFSSRNLMGLNLGNTDLHGSNLSNCVAYGTNFSNANLQGADLNNANLSNSDLSGANLEGANLTNTVLSGIRTDHRTNFSGAIFFSQIPTLQQLNARQQFLDTNPRLRLALAKNIVSLMEKIVDESIRDLKMFEKMSNLDYLETATHLYEKLQMMRDQLQEIKEHPAVSSNKKNALRGFEEPIDAVYQKFEDKLLHAIKYADHVASQLAAQHSKMQFK